MKRIVFIEIVLTLTTILLICCCAAFFWYATQLKPSLQPNLFEESYRQILVRNYAITITLAILSIIFAITNIVVMFFTALNNLSAFKPLADKLAAKRAAREEQRAEQAVVAKQERIAKLEAELDELKKDE